MKLCLIILGVIVVIVVIVVSFIAVIGRQSMDEDSIRDWGKEHGCKIVSIDRTFIDNGPFWIRQKHQRFYCVQVIDRFECSRVTYFRFGFCGYDQEWYNP